MADTLASLLMRNYPPGPNQPAGPDDDQSQYTPVDAIAQQYSLARALRSQQPATSWAGVAAQGLGAIGGNIVQGSADNALAANQTQRKQTIQSAATSKDLPSLSSTLMSSGDPTLQNTGLETRIKQITDNPTKEYTIRASQAQQYGLQPNTPEYRDFVLTGKLPGMMGEGPYGKAGAIFQNPTDGKFYSVQFGANGKKLVEEVTANGTSLSPAKGVSVVGDEMYANSTGAPVRNVGPQIAGGSNAKKTGELNAEGAIALPKQKIALEQSKVDADNLNSTIDQAISQADGWTTGMYGSAMSRVPGSAAHNLQATLDTVGANLGFDKLQDMRNNSPTGGALGNVSDTEGKQLRSAWRSVLQSQTADQLKSNLQKIKDLKTQHQALRQQAYEQDVARFGRDKVPDPMTGKLPSVDSGRGGFKYIGPAP